jgi:hypothetical protein
MILDNGETTFWNEDGSWTVGPLLPHTVHSHCIIQLNETISYLMGGYNNISKQFYSSVHQYNWMTGTWSQKADMMIKRASKKD